MNAFSILGVPEGCDDNVLIKKAYREQALKWHPDRVEEALRQDAEQQMQKINNAYELIKTAEARALYKAMHYASSSTGTLLLGIPVMKPKAKYSLQSAATLSRFWRQLTRSGTSSNQRNSRPFQNATIYAGKLLLYSQNVSMRVSVSIGPNIPKIETEKEFLFEQLVCIDAADFSVEQDLIQRLGPYVNTYEPQLNYKQISSAKDKDGTVDLNEGRLQENQFANSKQFLRQLGAMSLDVIFKTTAAVQGVDKEQIKMEEIVPDVTVTMCPKHPSCDECGTILVEMDAAIIEYDFGDRRYVCLANLVTGDCIGEKQASWLKKLFGARVVGALK